MLSACVILPFGPKACISAVALPRRLAKPWSPPVPKNPACDGLPMAWMRSWLCALPFSTSPMTRSGINLGHFWLLDCLQLFHTPRAGILLAIVVALCWGSADTVATFAARRQGTFATTFISLVASVTVLLLFGAFAFTRLALAPAVFVQCAGLGLLTGLIAAVGFFSLFLGLV